LSSIQAQTQSYFEYAFAMYQTIKYPYLIKTEDLTCTFSSKS